MAALAGLFSQLIILFFSVILHEVAHGKAAEWCGDGTARERGRLTFNPVPHIDPMGTVLLPLLLAVTHSPVMFGWAKPVPINPLRFRNPKRDLAIVGAAGPLSNLALAAFSATVFKLLVPAWGVDHPIVHFLLYAAAINVVLLVFNLIPLPPLDGSRVVMGLLPRHLAVRYARLERYGFILIFLLLFLGLNRWVIWPVVGLILRLLVG
jgi:Zn-dependent protease